MSQQSFLNTGVSSGAVFSPCRRYRYQLWRSWGIGARVAFIGLNPSTADELIDDPTIRRCLGFARRWGFAGLFMLNLYGWRATKPAELRSVADPLGPENDLNILRVCHDPGVERVVAAWGADLAVGGRNEELLAQLDMPIWCLGQTQDGHPKHPLYLAASTALQLYRAEKGSA